MNFLLLVRPYIYLELPGWGKVGQMFHVVGSDDSHWRDAPVKFCRGKMHGYLMRCDLRNWSQRMTWFLGRYYATEIQNILVSYVKQNDRVVDVGANVGMISALQSFLVGCGGCVEAFEPNPNCCEEIRWLIDTNKINNIQLHPIGLADCNTELTLKLRNSHSGTGTLAAVPEPEMSADSRIFHVPVRVGDEILLQSQQPVTLIKIDVEGFEGKVIDGLTGTLTQWKPLIIAELIENHLQRAGDSIANVVNRLKTLGYSAYWIDHARRYRGSFSLKPFDSEIRSKLTDAIFIHDLNPRSTHWLKSIQQKSAA